MTKTIILLITTYIFNLIDYCQTRYMISHFGLSAEANPIVRFLFEHNCAEVVKLIVPLILLTILGFIAKTTKEAIWFVYTLAAWYFLVIMHNFAIFIRIGLFL